MHIKVILHRSAHQSQVDMAQNRDKSVSEAASSRLHGDHFYPAKNTSYYESKTEHIFILAAATKRNEVVVIPAQLKYVRLTYSVHTIDNLCIWDYLFLSYYYILDFYKSMEPSAFEKSFWKIILHKSW